MNVLHLRGGRARRTFEILQPQRPAFEIDRHAFAGAADVDFGVDGPNVQIAEHAGDLHFAAALLDLDPHALRNRHLEDEFGVFLAGDGAENHRRTAQPQGNRVRFAPRRSRRCGITQLALLARPHEHRSIEALDFEARVPGEFEDPRRRLFEQDRFLRETRADKRREQHGRRERHGPAAAQRRSKLSKAARAAACSACLRLLPVPRPKTSSSINTSTSNSSACAGPLVETIR